jgi:hypothetical protein
VILKKGVSLEKRDFVLRRKTFCGKATGKECGRNKIKNPIAGQKRSRFKNRAFDLYGLFCVFQ